MLSYPKLTCVSHGEADFPGGWRSGVEYGNGKRELGGCTVRWEHAPADPRLLVAVAGEVDMANATELREVVTGLVQRAGLSTLCVDLHGVTFIDSSGLSSLLALKAGADSTGLSFQLSNLTDTTRRVFEISGLVDYLNLTPVEHAGSDPEEGRNGRQ